MAENVALAKEEGVTRSQLNREVDDQKFSWFHVKAILVSGVGFYTDAYDLFVISIVKPMIAIIYFPQFNGKLRLSDDLWITGVALAGTLCGQVFFGVMGDYLGRKKVYLVTLLLMIFATIAQALSASTVKGVGIIAMLAFWRFILGFGIGGDYPLSASIVSEYANKRWRGAFLASVFAMQGFGIVSGAIIGIIVCAAYQDSIKFTSILYLDYVWRIIIGLGCVPAVLTIYLRTTLPETPRFVADVERDETRALKNVIAVKANTRDFDESSAVPMAQQNRINMKDLLHYLTYPSIFQNRNFWVLVGTTSTWFLLDIAFYSQNLFLPNVLTDIGYNPSIKLPASNYYKASDPQAWTSKVVAPANSSMSIGSVYLYDSPRCTGACAQKVYDKVFKTASGNAIVAMMGTVPGYWFTIALVDYIGRVPIQFGGFGIMTAVLICLASGYTQIVKASKWIFIVMYAMTFFFANFGPNATTFITPVELFHTKYRSTLHGFSAACGKAGAIVGAFAIGRFFTTNDITLQTSLAILASTNALGMFMTIFVPETKGLPLELSANASNSVWGRMCANAGRPLINPHVDEAAAVPEKDNLNGAYKA